MKEAYRSHCPISFALDVFGDRWSLLVLRDILFRGKSRYKEFLASEEGIATNVLSERLNRLEKEGLVSKLHPAGAGRQFIYRPTAKALDLLPVLLEISVWSAKYDPLTAAPSAVIKYIRKDRKGFIGKIRRQFAL